MIHKWKVGSIIAVRHQILNCDELIYAKIIKIKSGKYVLKYLPIPIPDSECEFYWPFRICEETFIDISSKLARLFYL